MCRVTGARHYRTRATKPVDEAVDVCRQIAEGLEAAHEAGVVHRDLKPANVRVTPDGKVKVLDFGLAKPAREASGSTHDSVLATEAGQVLGTPTYMAPEQARGKPIDRRVAVRPLAGPDVVVLVEVLGLVELRGLAQLGHGRVAALDQALAGEGIQAVILTGGTGVAPRDVTPESVEPMLERVIPGFGELFRALSYEEIGSAALLSRALAGIAGGRVVFVLPGSRGAVRLGLEKLVLPELGHLAAEAVKTR